MKKLIPFLFCPLLLCGLTSVSFAQDEKKAEKSADGESELQKSILANPDDITLFNKYMSANLGTAVRMINADPDKAEKILAEMSAFVDKLEPTEARAKSLVGQAKRVIGVYNDRIALSRTTLDELGAKLAESPSDQQVIRMLVSKANMEASPLARSAPEKAELIVNKAKGLLEDAKAKSEDESVKDLIDQQLRGFARMESTIAAGKKLIALIGQDAAELEVESWANGEELSPADLKGKVVLLDFWAVWCGPCIATFPHLREWHEKYSDKGLVIVGLTRFYNYEWNEDAERATRAKEQVEKTDELAMLEKFADHHDLEHRFAIQKDGSLSDYYGVSGIPHAVVIDQKGKIRLIRVGSGEANAKAIDDMLKELLGA